MLTAGIIANNGTHGGAISTTDINNGGSSVLTDFLAGQPYNSSQPKAFLNWVIVDEEFKKVSSSFHMGAVQVPAINSTSENAKTLVGPAGMTVRRNGWLYVYLSNESNQDVYFDDLTINHKRGPVVEANNYYAFGLEIPGLGSKAIGFGGNSDNRIKYSGKELQSKEFNDGSGLAWEDYGARKYDPQIGRWNVIDPMAEKFENLSSYNFSNNNPILNKDIGGKYPIPIHVSFVMEGSHVTINYTGTINNKILNLSQSENSKNLVAHLSTYNINIKGDGDKVLNGPTYMPNGKIHYGTVDNYFVTGRLNLQITSSQIKSLNELNKSDQLVVIVDNLKTINPKYMDKVMKADGLAGSIIFIDANSGARLYVAAHENLHNVGLLDLYDIDENGNATPAKGDPDNVMSNTGGLNITAGQIGEVLDYLYRDYSKNQQERAKNYLEKRAAQEIEGLEGRIKKRL